MTARVDQLHGDILAGPPASIATIERRGGAVLSMPSVAADADPFRRTIVVSISAELLAAELWRRTSAEERCGFSSPTRP